MLIKKTLGKYRDNGKKLDAVTLEPFEFGKKRLRKVTASGTELGISLDEPLCDGDVLYEDETTVIAAFAAPCRLIEISAGSMREMGRLCFEIGNRHRSLSICDDCVKIPFDETDLAYLERLGFKCRTVTEKFTDCIVCRGHGDHVHSTHSHAEHCHDEHGH